MNEGPRGNSKTVSRSGERSKGVSNLRAARPTRGVDHLADLEAIELASGADSVRAHVVESKPVPDLEVGWEHRLRGHAVDRIARRTPNAAHVLRLRRRDVERTIHGQHIRMLDLVIKQDAVERPIDTIVDVI